MHRRISFIVLVLAFALSACAGGPRLSAGDSQATAVSLAGTQAALTLAVLPTLTMPPSNTPLPTSTFTAAPSKTAAPTKTATSTPESAATGASATAGTQTAAATSTLSSTTTANTATVTTTATVSGTATVTYTPTPGPLLWGTVPPDVPYGHVTLVNLTNDMVYISFHCVLANGLTSYLEYPVYAKLGVKLPAGPCHYVAWVKGQQFTGDIHIKKAEEYTFTFKPKKIIITQP